MPAKSLKKDKYDILICRFPYGRSEDCDIADWLATVVVNLKAHPRVGEIQRFRINDTPVTMSRNRAVEVAQELGADFMLMADSDMKADAYAAENPYRLELNPEAKPFFPSSLDFAIKQREMGNPCVVAAPYCGPPPWENVYVFKWANRESNHPNMDFILEAYTREETTQMVGIQECAALPTGICLIDVAGLEKIVPPWFYYEWDTENESQKSSTEDVTFTRDLALRGVPQFCNWDAWAGHWKLKCVGRPIPVTARQIGDSYRRAVLKDVNIQGPDEAISLSRKRLGGNGEPARPPVYENPFKVAESPHVHVRQVQSAEDVEDRFSLPAGTLKPQLAIDGAPVDDAIDAPEPEAAEKQDQDAIPAIVDWSSVEHVIDSFAGQQEPLLIFHVNCSDGLLTKSMLKSDHDLTIVCVEDWSGDVYDRFESNLSGFLGRQVLPMKMSKEAAALQWRDPRQGDVLFLENPSEADIRDWLKHLSFGGVICGIAGEPWKVLPPVLLGGSVLAGGFWWVKGNELKAYAIDHPEVDAPAERLIDGKVVAVEDSKYSDLDLEQFGLMVRDRVVKQPSRPIRVVHIAEKPDPEITAVARAALVDAEGDSRGDYWFCRSSVERKAGVGWMIDVLFFDPISPKHLQSLVSSWSPHLQPRAIVCGWGHDVPGHSELTDYLNQHPNVQYPPETNLWWYRHETEELEETVQPEEVRTEQSPRRIGVKRPAAE